jgi:hypothetical protein
MKAAAPNAATPRSSGLAAVLARKGGGGGGGSDRRVTALGSAAGRLLKAFAIQVEFLWRLRHGTGQ